MGTTIATNASLSAPLAIVALDNDVEEVRIRALSQNNVIVNAENNSELCLFATLSKC